MLNTRLADRAVLALWLALLAGGFAPLDAAARGQPFDLLLTRIQMPEMDGYTLARTLRARKSPIPIIALTAHAMAEDRAKCLDAGCNDYASKPIDRAALLATCAKWLGTNALTPAHAAT